MAKKKKTAKTKGPAKAGARREPRRKRAREGIVHVEKTFTAEGQETSFTRADLVFTGVDHGDMSYEVRVFLNNRKADEDTPRSPENGYAGRFVVFGHGSCYGDLGHCDVVASPNAALDRHRPHPVTPQTRILTITDALRRIVDKPGQALEAITLVPISQNPRRADRGLTASLFRFQDVELQTYR